MFVLDCTSFLAEYSNQRGRPRLAAMNELCRCISMTKKTHRFLVCYKRGLASWTNDAGKGNSSKARLVNCTTL